MSDNASVRLVSAGTGKSIPLPGTITLDQLRDLAELSDDVTLAFNGETVPTHQEGEITLNGGEQIVASPRKVSHG
jgi:hypothetical protein